MDTIIEENDNHLKNLKEHLKQIKKLEDDQTKERIDMLYHNDNLLELLENINYSRPQEHEVRDYKNKLDHLVNSFKEWMIKIKSDLKDLPKIEMQEKMNSINCSDQIEGWNQSIFNTFEIFKEKADQFHQILLSQMKFDDDF